MNNTILGMNILADYSIDMNYNIADLPIYVKEEKLSDFPGMQNLLHWNDGLEILFVSEGNMHIVSAGNKIIISEGNICFINPGCVHSFESINDSDCKYACYIIEISAFVTNKEIIEQYLIPLYHPFYPGIHLLDSKNEENAFIVSLLNKILLIAKEKKPSYELHVVGFFHMLIAELYNTYHNSLKAKVKHNAKLTESMKQMLSFIYNNYSHNISIDELCEAGNVSRGQCFDLFKKYTNETPSKFILKCRLAIARNLLSNTTLPIAQIATQCGFTHQSHLTSHFSGYYGITPHNYRKQKSSIQT